MIDFSYPHFPQIFYLFLYSQQAICTELHASPRPSTAFDRPRLPTTGPPLLGKAPRPDHSSNETAMAVFSHLQRSTVEPQHSPRVELDMETLSTFSQILHKRNRSSCSSPPQFPSVRIHVSRTDSPGLTSEHNFSFVDCLCLFSQLQ